MRIQLSEHFNYNKLLRFVMPSVIMMIFTSIYGVVDGLFVSNFVGKVPFAAINLIMPFLMVLGALGFMIGTGGSAIVAKTLGEKKREKANEYFSMLIYVTIISGIVIAFIGVLFIEPISEFLGAEGEMLKYCIVYGRIIIVALPAFMLQNVFQSFLITAEKPRLGLIVTVLAGITNMVLDFLFIAVFKWGVQGAALATAISQTVGGVLPFIYFTRKNDSLLQLTKAKFNGEILIKTCTNGSSELMSNISSSLVGMLYNFQLLRVAGENGVAAYGVIMYVNFIFVAIFIGYSIGTAPIVGYNYGAANNCELQNVFKKSLKILAITGVVLVAAGITLSGTLAKVFVGYDIELMEMTKRGLLIYSTAFIFTGFNIFGSAFFTALNNGLISAIISFLRTLVFQLLAILILPFFFDLNGIWFAIVVAELAAFVITVICLIIKRKEYKYI